MDSDNEHWLRLLVASQLPDDKTSATIMATKVESCDKILAVLIPVVELISESAAVIIG